ncbi:hypothetical protein C8Q80DRAFT_761794 [Daedaleopsis nitida]|nr:hypothetical protein C8Q80DRAFT_761794 [Daedaleopsis nitida]
MVGLGELDRLPVHDNSKVASKGSQTLCQVLTLLHILAQSSQGTTAEIESSGLWTESITQVSTSSVFVSTSSSYLYTRKNTPPLVDGTFSCGSARTFRCASRSCLAPPPGYVSSRTCNRVCIHLAISVPCFLNSPGAILAVPDSRLLSLTCSDRHMVNVRPSYRFRLEVYPGYPPPPVERQVMELTMSPAYRSLIRLPYTSLAKLKYHTQSTL